MMLRDTFFKNITIFDGQTILTNQNVLLSQGKIWLRSPDSQNQNIDIIDGHKRTLMPGLIDAHTHYIPGALQQALNFGVTTELDMFSEPGLVFAAQREAYSKTDRADLLSAGIGATAPGGHPSIFYPPFPTITEPEHAKAFVDARIAEGSNYIKIFYEAGATNLWRMPTISLEVLRALIDAAHVKNRLVVVHIGSVEDARTVVAAGADGLAHLPSDIIVDEKLMDEMVARKTFAITTLSTLSAACGRTDGAELARDKAVAERLRPYWVGALRQQFPGTGTGRDWNALCKSVKKLFDAGIVLLAGTDAPNPGTVHGASMYQELELLVATGLPPIAALRAATSASAATFGLTNRGSISDGSQGDVILVKGDPAKQIADIRNVEGIWRAGVRVERSILTQSPEIQEGITYYQTQVNRAIDFGKRMMSKRSQ